MNSFWKALTQNIEQLINSWLFHFSFDKFFFDSPVNFLLNIKALRDLFWLGLFLTLFTLKIFVHRGKNSLNFFLDAFCVTISNCCRMKTEKYFLLISTCKISGFSHLAKRFQSAKLFSVRRKCSTILSLY